MIRPGFRSITPYLIVPGAGRLIEFLKEAFGAEEKFRVNRPDGCIMHAEVQMGDSMLELAETPVGQTPRLAPLHLFVEDVDAVYRRAIAAGGTGKSEPKNQEYGSREAFVLDPSGNHWYIATQIEGPPVPKGMHNLTLGLRVAGAARLISFLERAFDAKPLERVSAPDGRIVYSQIQLGDSVLEAADPHGEFQPMPAGIHFYVDDVDALYRRAIKEGGESLSEPADQSYGERSAGILDAFGNHWYIASHLAQS